LEVLKAAVLGIVQGLTEFFPVSSSAHLVITPFILKWDYIPVYYTVLLHFATLLALVTVFYREIWRIIKHFFSGIFIARYRKTAYFKLALFIIIATLPALVAGLFLEDYVEGFFSNPLLVAVFLLVTSFFLFTGEYAGKRKENLFKKNNTGSNPYEFEKTLIVENMANTYANKKTSGYLIAFITGIGQAIAIFPGISRSGSTISFARFFGVKREACVRFSMLLSIPVIFGAFILEFPAVYEAVNSGQDFSAAGLITGFIFSYASGLFAIKFLVKISQRRNFNFFAIYCILLSVLIFVLILIRKV